MLLSCYGLFVGFMNPQMHNTARIVNYALRKNVSCAGFVCTADGGLHHVHLGGKYGDLSQTNAVLGIVYESSESQFRNLKNRLKHIDTFDFTIVENIEEGYQLIDTMFLNSKMHPEKY